MALIERIPRPDANGIVQALFTLIWLLALARIVAPGIGLDWVMTVMMGALFVIAMIRLRRAMVPLVATLGLIALGVAAYRGDWPALVIGLERSSIFVAFFGTLVVLRATAERRPETARARTLFAGLREDQRIGATLYGAHVIGSVLVVGAHAILSPIYGSKASEASRYAAAIISQRGMGLAGLWSPFWVAMVIAYQHLPNVPLWSVMVLGMTLALPGLLIGQAMAGGASRGGLVALLPVLPSVLIAAIAVVTLASFTPLKALEALVIGVPVLCLLSLVPLGRAVLIDMLRTAVSRTPAVQGEIALIACAFILGRVLVGPLVDNNVADWLSANMPPAPVVIAIVIGVPTLLAMIGLHQIVTITVLLVPLVEVPSGVSDLVLMEAALIAWAFSSMIGLSAISTVAAATLFGVGLNRLAWGPNVGFALVFGLFATAALSAVNHWIT